MLKESVRGLPEAKEARMLERHMTNAESSWLFKLIRMRKATRKRAELDKEIAIVLGTAQLRRNQEWKDFRDSIGR